MKIFIVIVVLLASLFASGCVLQNGNTPIIVGNDTDSHGCKASAGYAWCAEKGKCLRVWEENCTQLAGNDRDSHGCIISAGYSWCAQKSKCLRAWEENCTTPNAPRACTDEAKICPDGSAVGRQGPSCEFAACPPTNYTLYGRVTVGPMCPTVPCNVAFDYTGARVNVYNAASKGKVAIANVGSNGYYGVNLEPGAYLVNVTSANGSALGFPSLDYTQAISMESGHVYQMDFDIDTGIR